MEKGSLVWAKATQDAKQRTIYLETGGFFEREEVRVTQTVASGRSEFCPYILEEVWGLEGFTSGISCFDLAGDGACVFADGSNLNGDLGPRPPPGYRGKISFEIKYG